MVSLPTRLDLLRHVAAPDMVAAEVGVLQGDFAIEIAKTLNPRFLTLVDLWDTQDAAVYPGGFSGLTLGDHQNHYEYVCKRFYKFPCVSIMRMLSTQAADLLYPKSFDFVYIDANHTYEAVKADLDAWYPLVKDGGWICGHDYTGPHKGVKKAVDEFLEDRSYKLGVLTNEFEAASWGIKKQ